MDENDPLSEYNNIPLGHNRTNGAVYLKINFKLKICSVLCIFVEYNLYSIMSLIVSVNQFAMCTCIIIAVLIHVYHDVIIQILPSISMWLYTHIGLNRPHFLTYYVIFYIICSV